MESLAVTNTSFFAVFCALNLALCVPRECLVIPQMPAFFSMDDWVVRRRSSPDFVILLS